MRPIIFGIDPKWNSLLPLVVINVLMLTTVVIFAFKYRRRPRTDLSARAQSKWVGPFLYEYWGWFIAPLENLFIYLKLSPNFFTTMGFVLSLASGWAFATGHFGMAGWLLIIGGTCDMFDGRIARRTNKSTRSGAFYDSIMDRFGEAMVFIGLVIFYRDSWVLYVVLGAWLGATMVSYARAKGESMGIDCKVGAMQRAERIVYIGVGSIFSPPFRQIVNPGATEPVEYLAIAALILVAVMTLITAIYRMVYIIHKLRPQDGKSAKPPRSVLLKKLSARYLDI